jgi:arylformamidase
MPLRTSVFQLAMLLLTGTAFSAQAQDGGLRAALYQRRLATMQSSLPAGTQVIRDVSYGNDPLQRLDVYAPAHAGHAPIIVMIHGGAWAFGDKTSRGVVENKVARWVPRGLIVISVNYRMLPQTEPAGQADDVAHALAYVQQHAAQWGGDGASVILMGHSAGAHLVALVSTDPAIGQRYGVAPWLGTVSLDSAALDVEATMTSRHLPLYDRAFGDQSSSWGAVSPMQQLHAHIVPFLAVCSTQRRDSCPQAQNFVAKAISFGSRASVVEEDLTHEQINEQLGLSSGYTSQVEGFMRGLSPQVGRALAGP